MTSSSIRWVLPGVLGAALVMAPVVLAGQAAPPDFHFRGPTISLTLKGGMFLPRAQSDVFDFTTAQLTLDRSDFRSPSGGGEVGVWFGNRTELVVGFDLSQVTRNSELRDWVEENGDPILQDMRFASGPTGYVGGKVYLLPLGEQFGQFVWIPRTLNAHVGGGLGRTSYTFEQWGDFVDEEEGTIFTGDFTSTGESLMYYASGGVDVRFLQRTYLTFEGKYQWADARLNSSNFSGFEPIDLSGLRLSVGLSFRY